MEIPSEINQYVDEAIAKAVQEERAESSKRKARQEAESRINFKRKLANILGAARRYAAPAAAIGFGFTILGLGYTFGGVGLAADIVAYGSIGLGTAAGSMLGLTDASKLLIAEADNEEVLLLGDGHGKLEDES